MRRVTVIAEKKPVPSGRSSYQSTARRPPRRPNMSALLTKVGGVVLLVATVGLASCQALWVEVPGITLPIELQD